jgi:hypothetical protein
MHMPGLTLRKDCGEEDIEIPHIASLADTYFRFQKALVQLGGHLTQRLGAFEPPKPNEQPWAYEAREAMYWYVSEHTMHLSSEYENALGGFDIKDSIDDETWD